MTYRIADLDVPGEEPFRYDSLERRPLVEFLSGLIGRTGGPFVLALDSPWGSGKTTLVRMLAAKLNSEGFQYVYFNAWQVDYVTDPLVALVASIDGVELGGGTAEATFKGHMKAIRKVTGLVAKRGLVAVAKGLTIGALDIDKEVEAVATELAGDATGDLVEAFQKEKDLLKKFREELDAAVKQLPIAGKHPTLVFFIDELDRCRPTFAIELLERVKHLFDVSNIVFVLSIDKQQLEASTAAVYGVGINAAEYLRRFIDLEYGIPVAKTRGFTESLLSRFALDDAFAKRAASKMRNDREDFVEVFTSLADLFGLSLRARERCITRLRVVLDQTPSELPLNPIIVALLIVLRSNKRDLFARLADSQAAPKEVIEYLAGLPGGRTFVTDRMGIVLEAYLMAGDNNQDRKLARDAELKTVLEDDNSAPELRERARQLLEMRQHVGGMRWGFTLGTVAAKVDLAASIRE